ncbi:MAG TPA: T9SS type A sorting domain-containing protein [Acidobacteriota bacterium]|nr:T9SS type A sorting domain-containing protein [Acidobacteriota bacterium]
MNSVGRFLVLGALVLLSPSAARAQAPSVSPISDITVNAGVVATVNVVAVDLNGDAITLTTSAPLFATLNPPTAGTGSVVTSLTLAPTAGDVGVFTASVKATAAGDVDSTTFTITVAAAGSNQAPMVTAPALQTGAEGTNLMFTVTAVDADADVISSLIATGLPAGASFTPNGTNTSATFSWTPGFSQAGHYDVVFTATSGASTGGAATHVFVENTVELAIVEIPDVTIEEGATVSVNVDVTGPTTGTIDVTSSLPAFATLNPPTSSAGTGTLATTVTIAPPAGAAGIYDAKVTATAGGQTDSTNFTITVTPAPAGDVDATASLVGNFNTHKKFICFHVKPVDDSFDARDVVLSGVTLEYGGQSITALAERTHVSWDCEGDEDCENGDCEDDDDGEWNDGAFDSLNCDAMLRACFSMPEILGLFDGAPLPSSLVNATVNGTLTGGETFVAVIGPKFPGDNGNHGENGKKGLNAKVRPNPVNPTTTITFTLSQPGKVRVAIYDLQGRLVKTVLDGSRSTGDQSVTWNGSNSRSAAVPSGVYFVRIHAPQGEESQRVTVLR